VETEGRHHRYAVAATTTLPAEDRETLLEMARQTEAYDGRPPLNDEALQAIQHPESLPPAQAPLHVTVHRSVVDDSGEQTLDWVGYAFLRDLHSDATGSLFVIPDARRAGAGRRLLAACIEAAETSVRIWAPGNSVAARTLAASAHLVPVRELLIMSRSLSAPILDPELPDGVTLREFRPGEDDDQWLRVNGRAFADHPEQGRVTHDGLKASMSEPWFDPADFLVAVDESDRMLGFHWMKQHSDTTGEVYVLGVDPDASRRGLGKALLRAGLIHLRDDLGLAEVILYVEGDNDPAVGLYVLNGFDVMNRDVLYGQQHHEE
jgi:mycothiol synthase